MTLGRPYRPDQNRSERRESSKDRIAQDEWQAVVRGGGPRGDGGAQLQPFAVGVLNLDALFFVAAALVAVSYLMDCLYAERRDRSSLRAAARGAGQA